MTELRPPYDNEINLYDFIKSLWDSKSIIITFILVFFIFSSAFFVFKDTAYESKIIYRLDKIPPFKSSEQVSTDFQESFYSISVFNEWKRSNSNASLMFKDFSKVVNVEEFQFTKDENNSLATFEHDKKGDSFIIIRSNQLKTLDDFFNYVTFINKLLKNKYLALSKDYIRIIESLSKGMVFFDSDITEELFSINKYTFMANEGEDVLIFQKPTIPKKVSPKSILIISISSFIGGMIGILYVLISNAARQRKDYFAKP